jgi:hypothetical protein
VFGLSTVAGILDRRFLRNAFLPSFALVSLGLLVGLAGPRQLGSAVIAWGRLTWVTQLLLAGAFVAAVWLVAAIVDSQTRSIVQAYEGYWHGPLRPLRSYGERRHRAMLDQLREAGQVETIYPNYPLSRGEVMATRLGNILRASESYPLDRYGADGVLVWPRLYPLLPEAVLTAVGQGRSSLEFLLVLSWLAAAFSVLSGAYLLVVTGQVWLFLLCLWGGAAVALLTYRSSLASARLYAEVLRAAFDLHRLDLLPYVGLTQPADARMERQRWEQFRRLVLRNDPLPEPYPPRPSPAAS